MRKFVYQSKQIGNRFRPEKPFVVVRVFVLIWIYGLRIYGPHFEKLFFKLQIILFRAFFEKFIFVESILACILHEQKFCNVNHIILRRPSPRRRAQ